MLWIMRRKIILQTTHIYKRKKKNENSNKARNIFTFFFLYFYAANGYFIIHSLIYAFCVSTIMCKKYIFFNNFCDCGCNTVPFHSSEHTEVQIKINQIANKLFLLIFFFCFLLILFFMQHSNSLAAATT